MRAPHPNSFIKAILCAPEAAKHHLAPPLTSFISPHNEYKEDKVDDDNNNEDNEDNVDNVDDTSNI